MKGDNELHYNLTWRLSTNLFNYRECSLTKLKQMVN